MNDYDCPRCQRTNSASAAFCRHCGLPLAVPAPAVPAAMPALAAETVAAPAPGLPPPLPRPDLGPVPGLLTGERNVSPVADAVPASVPVPEPAPFPATHAEAPTDAEYVPTAAEMCWYGPVRRFLYGSLWAIYSILLVVAGFSLLNSGSYLAGLGAFGAAILTTRYSYRIWTWQARSLWFVIFF